MRNVSNINNLTQIMGKMNNHETVGNKKGLKSSYDKKLKKQSKKIKSLMGITEKKPEITFLGKIKLFFMGLYYKFKYRKFVKKFKMLINHTSSNTQIPHGLLIKMLEATHINLNTTTPNVEDKLTEDKPLVTMNNDFIEMISNTDNGDMTYCDEFENRKRINKLAALETYKIDKKLHNK